MKTILRLIYEDKVAKNIPGPIRSFTVKENHLGSVVSKILHYRQKKLTTLYNRINNSAFAYLSMEVAILVIFAN